MRAEHKEAFDALFTKARCHSAEAAASARAIPFEAMAMAILLEMELELRSLRREVEVLRQQAAALSSSPPLLEAEEP